jgi:hypothetical protein
MKTLVVILVGLSLYLVGAVGHAAGATADAERAEVLLQQGTAAFEAGRMREALVAHQRAWLLSHTFRTAVGAGQVELHLGLYREAAGHLSYALAHLPPGIDAELRGHVQDGFHQASSHVLTLRIRVGRDGVDVTVDGEGVGTSPLDLPVFAEPGTHTVVAVDGGATLASASAEGPAGATREVTLELPEPAPTVTDSAPAGAGQEPAASPAAAPEDAPPPPVEASPGLSPSTWALLIGGGLTAGAVLSSVAFSVSAASSDSDVDAARARAVAGGDSCPSAGSAACDDLAAAIESRNAADRGATVSAVTAGALGVSTAVVAAILWPQGALPGADVSVSAGPRGSAVLVRGRF